MELHQFIQNPDLLNVATLDELHRLVEEYPFFQPARLLYVQNLFRLHHPSFSAELERASLMIPDCRALFTIVEAADYVLSSDEALGASDPALSDETDGNRTISLIDNFLSTQNGADSTDASDPHALPTMAELTSDYAAYLAQADATQTPANVEDTPATDSRSATLIDNFISETNGKQRYEIPSLATDEQPPVDAPVAAADSTMLSAAYCNERVANLCIQQGQYAEALEIFRTICLNNPEKSATFANQMRLLDIIVRQEAPTK